MDSLSRVKRRTAYYLVPALAAVIAVRQLYLSHAYALTPWKGGGFGMLASVDEPRSRFVRVYLLTPLGRVPVEANAPERVEQLATRIRFMPSPQRLNALADAVLETSWVVDTAPRLQAHVGARHGKPGRAAGAALGVARPVEGSPVEVSGVHVEVWRVRLEPSGPRLVRRKLTELTRARS